jgi:hypothetical protein
MVSDDEGPHRLFEVVAEFGNNEKQLPTFIDKFIDGNFFVG